MTAHHASLSHPLVRMIESIATPALAEEERAALVGLPMQVRKFRADQDIAGAGERAHRISLVLEGYACSYKVTDESKRQITALHLPGDMPDLPGLHSRASDSGVGTITPCTVGFVRHEALRDLCRTYPAIGDVLWRKTLIDAAILREWMLSIGRREARGRVAHLFCEIVTLMRARGLAQGDACEMPMTQVEIGDATGLSAVHTNRMIQEMRAEGLITLRAGTLTVLDWHGLEKAGGFDPAYLHLTKPVRSGLGLTLGLGGEGVPAHSQSERIRSDVPAR